MTSRRKFYRTLITVEVLSEDPFEFASLSQADHAITFGDCNGNIKQETVNEEIDGPTCARLLIESGSDAGFFRLTEDGEDADDE